jgi:hypothetical protein
MKSWTWLMVFGGGVLVLVAPLIPFATLEAHVTDTVYSLPCSTGWEMPIWGIDSYDGNGHGPSAGGEWFVDPGFEAGCAVNRALLVGGAAAVALAGGGLVASGIVLRRRTRR